MPTYEYECEKCGKVFEHFQNISDAPLTECPSKKCKGKVRRLLSGGAGLIFKGDGFYSTDYKNKSAPKSETPPCAAGNCCAAKGTCPAGGENS